MLLSHLFVFCGRQQLVASAINRHIDALQAVKQHREASETQQTIMVAAGGKGTGSVWLAMPSDRRDFMPDAHFVVATIARHGMLVAPPGATCCLRERSGTEAEGAMCGF